MKPMLRVLVGASAIAMAATAANATTTIITPSSPPPGTTFNVVGNPFTGTDPVSATIGHAGLPSGAFTDIYKFTIGHSGQGLIGSGSGGVTTNITMGKLAGVTDVDFNQVLVNGMAATITLLDKNGVACAVDNVGTCGYGEVASLSGVPITGGALNTISIDGTVGFVKGYRGPGLGSYGGSLTFIPNAPVPEPATWAMMLFGFFGVGMTMSRRRKRSQGLLQLA